MRRAATPLVVAYAALLAAHAAWLNLPYYWDEAGYFVPAALDFFRHGWLTPHTTLANGHPPLLSLYLAAAWSVAGFHPAATRCAMLAWSACGLAGVYRLGREMYGRNAGLAAALLLGVSPVWFAQSSLAQLDLPAAALVVWALVWRRRDKPPGYAACMAAACLMKDTAIAAPLALALWDFARAPGGARRWRALAPHAAAAAALGAWLVYFHAATGYWLGEPGYLAYNLAAASHSAARFGLAALRHGWQTAGYGGVGLLVALGWRRGMPRGFEWDCGVVMAAYLAFHGLFGGAVLARYMLPAQAVLILLLTPGLLRWPWRRTVVAACAAWLVLNWFWNPPYPFPYEDNLAWVKFVELHQAAARAAMEASAAHPGLVITTAWPATDELRNPDLGYVTHPVAVRAIEDFSPQSLGRAARADAPAALLLYSRQYEPKHDIARWPLWWRWSERYFQARPAAAEADWLEPWGLTPVFRATRAGQWITLALGR